MDFVYRYLDSDDGNNSTSTLDTNGQTVYTLDITAAITTDGVGLSESPVTYELIGVDVTGSGTVKLQFSLDGITWTDAVDGNGDAVSYTMSSSTLAEVYKDFQVVGTAQRWVIDGSNTAGTLTIKVV